MQYRELTLEEKYTLLYLTRIACGLCLFGTVVCAVLMMIFGSIDARNEKGLYLSLAFLFLFGLGLSVSIITTHDIEEDNYVWIRSDTRRKKLTNIFSLTLDDRIQIRTYRETDEREK